MGGDVERAVLFWLAYHCLFRPGEPLQMRVSDLVLPDWEALFLGEPGAAQVPRSKTGRATRFATTGSDILRPRQVVSWLLLQGVSTLVVGHQPHGDAPVLMRCAAPDGTSGELIVVTADTSFSGGAAGRNCHGRRA